MQLDLSCPCCSNKQGLSGFPNRIPLGNTFAIFKIMNCPVCAHAWLATPADQQHLIEEVYDHDYAGHRIDKTFEMKCREALRLDISPHMPPPARLLDVGCGNGSFVLAAQEAGYDTLGIDISEEGVAFAVSRGANAHHYDFLSHAFDVKFDIITMWDVVEHLHAPAIFIQRARELLNPGGILIIKTPSIGKLCLLFVRLFGNSAPALLQAPNHIHYWTRSSMAALLTQQGLTNVTYWPSRGFRASPEQGSMTKQIKRSAKTLLKKYGGNGNLYLMAHKATNEPGTTSSQT